MKKEQLLNLLQTSLSVRKAFFQKHLDKFAQYYFPHYVKTNVGDLHKEWCEDLLKYKKIARAAPREHAKSTWHTFIYTMYCIAYQQKDFIVLISDTGPQAEEFLGSIIEELETNERFIKDFGKIAGYIPESVKEKKKWTAKDIITLTGIKVIARGWKSKLRGLKHRGIRPDLIILDDVENDENVNSEDQRKKMANMFYKSILNLGSKDTQIIVVGTILHFDSLLHNLINSPRDGWYTKLHRAIEANVPIWSEWWSLERLDQKKSEIGSIAFEQEFMNNPLDPSTQILNPSAWHGNINFDDYIFYVYVDLAISERETADFTAMVPIGRHKETGKLSVMPSVKFRGNVTTIIEKIFELHSLYKFEVIGIESVAYQKAFFQILQVECSRRGEYLPIIEVEVDKDKVRRAIEVSPYLENGTVEFDSNDQDLLYSVMQFPKAAHDDDVDSLVGGINLAIGRNEFSFSFA